jgi:NitT/TauT family transport system substrate-binding protein
MRSISTALFLIISILLSTVQSFAGENALKKVSLIPQWVPQAQFAGYYMGLEKDFYKERGIDLTIITGGPDSPPIDLLKDGTADFATVWLTSGLVLVAKKARGVREPRDMEGKKVGLWGPVFQLQPKAFFKKYNITPQIVRQSYSVNLFLRDGVDVVSAMWYNEYHTILNSGLNPEELTTFMFHEHGLNLPEDGIYALEDTCADDPGLCESFIRASEQGWRYAFAHPEETIDLIMKNLEKEHIPATRVHQRWMLDRIRDLMIPQEDVPMGMLSEEDYYRVANALYSGGFIKKIPKLSDFYRKPGEINEK